MTLLMLSLLYLMMAFQVYLAIQNLLEKGRQLAHIGCYVGIFLRGGNKLDREGRDYWLKPLAKLGVIELVTYLGKSTDSFTEGHIKAKSPNSAYRLSDGFENLLKNYSDEAFEEYFSQNEIARRLELQAKLLSESIKSHGKGDHDKLIKLTIKHYVPNYLKDFEVLYIDNADGDRVSQEEKEKLDKYGVVITIDDNWPDVILVSPDGEALWFIEAVCSDGEVDLKKAQGLENLCKKNGKVLAGLTTTYLDWKSVAKRQSSNKNLVGGSFLWIAEDPSKVFKIFEL